MNRTILFITGTRADFGKLKPLMTVIQDAPRFTCAVFVTGMHMLKAYGSTHLEVTRAGFENVLTYHNQHLGEPMETVLANTIQGLSRYVRESRPDLIVVHGDRAESLAGAIVGSFNNILVAHVEGGERSGTIDELIRHSITKLSHLHFVSNEEARQRLLQMGESSDTIFVIGSPDLDLMASKNLPTLAEVKERYDIPFEEYAILLYHPVTTERDAMDDHVHHLVRAVVESKLNYVVIFPNNDPGSETILAAYQEKLQDSRFKMFPSLRFEYFLSLLKNCSVLVGNSSAGIREAPLYGVPSVNVGSRQHLRGAEPTIIDCQEDSNSIGIAISLAMSSPRIAPPNPKSFSFGAGDSAQKFGNALANEAPWRTPVQKVFLDTTP